MQRTWALYIEQLSACLRAVCFTDGNGQPLDTDAAFSTWANWTAELGHRRRSIYLIGNGASASMASHFAADLAKNAHLHSQVFHDPALLTAVSNDLGFERVFAEPLRRRAEEGDMLVAISSSGKSPNILAAIDVARDHRMTIVTLSSFAADNPLRRRGDLNLFVASDTYGAAESTHASALHWWMDLVRLQRNPTSDQP